MYHGRGISLRVRPKGRPKHWALRDMCHAVIKVGEGKCLKEKNIVPTAMVTLPADDISPPNRVVSSPRDEFEILMFAGTLI